MEIEHYHWLVYMVAFLAAFSVTVATTPLAKRISVRLNAIDHPKARGLGVNKTPRLGGIAIVLGFMAAMFVLVPFMGGFSVVQFSGFIVGSLLIVGLGIADDVLDVNAKIKLAVQLGAALILVFTGTRIDMIMWPFVIPQEILDVISVPITIVWIIAVTNAVNLIDGMDGLAAGVSSISSVVLLILCILSGEPMAVVFSAALAGSSMGFLPRNFNPAEIYMGDTGATFLGYVLAATSIMGLFKTYTLLSVMVAILAMALPILDTAFAFVRRLLNHQPIMTADRGHLHHRLIDAGYTQKQSVTILYVISLITGAMALIIAVADPIVFGLSAVSLFTICVVIYLYRKRVKGTEATMTKDVAEEPMASTEAEVSDLSK